MLLLFVQDLKGDLGGFLLGKGLSVFESELFGLLLDQFLLFPLDLLVELLSEALLGFLDAPGLVLFFLLLLQDSFLSLLLLELFLQEPLLLFLGFPGFFESCLLHFLDFEVHLSLFIKDCTLSLLLLNEVLRRRVS